MATRTSLLGTSRPDDLSSVRALVDEARRQGMAYFPSPVDWRDEVLYFLLPDRFSDGNEAARPLLTRADIVALRQAPGRPGWNWQNWAESGKRWQGGTINGIRAHLDYLQGLGVTAIWVGPVFRQRARLDTYHGYGVQDFLDVDPRFGTRADLLELIDAAHARQMRIILDVIINHSGDNWGYLEPGKAVDQAINEPSFKQWPTYYGDPNNPGTAGWKVAWRDADNSTFTTDPSIITGRDQAGWPRELQTETVYTRAGLGGLDQGSIEETHAEHKRTDFFSLKDFALDTGDTLSFLSECFRYWIALSDCDGFRIDTVKHMALEETRNFCGAIRELADSLGKRNFLLVGEIAGGESGQDYILDHLAVLQRNMSAALDIGSARTKLQMSAKGLVPAGEYLEGFKEASQGFASHRAMGNRHVSILDDHDHVEGPKVRFSADIPDSSPVKDHQVVSAVAMQLFTLGIPCIYYGTEQAFAGPAHSQRAYLLAEGWNDGKNHGDRYLRETMFGPDHPRAHHSLDMAQQLSSKDTSLPGFGPFGTAGQHCFDTSSPAYVRIAALCAARSRYLILRVGRQYASEIRLPWTGFVAPAAGELVAWSRLLDNQEAVIVINPNGTAARGGDVVVSAIFSAPGARFTVVCNTAHVAAGAAGYTGSHPTGSTVVSKGRSRIEEPAYIEIRDVPPAEVLVLVREF